MLFAFAIRLKPMAPSMAHYQKILREHGFKASMSGKGNCHDNAAVETFFKTIKAELIWRRTWETRRHAETAIFQYINGFYNPRRRHSALGGKSPLAFERRVAQTSTWSSTNTRQDHTAPATTGLSAGPQPSSTCLVRRLASDWRPSIRPLLPQPPVRLASSALVPNPGQD